MKANAIEIVMAYIDAINHGDIDRISGLMTEDHSFIDSGGTVLSGAADTADAWREYFKMFPDYKIEAENIVTSENMIAVFGAAVGTYNGNRGPVPENRIKMTAAWKAVVENDKIKIWQVYADWTEGFKIIEADKKSGGNRAD